MSDLSAPETVTMGMVAVMAIKMAFDTVRSMRVRNGNVAPTQASVTKESASEFWLLQKGMEALLLGNAETARRSLEIAERILKLLEQVHADTDKRRR